MHERYEYRTIRVERAAWRNVAGAIYGSVADGIARGDGSIFGLWRGEIGWYTDEGALLTAWPPGAEPGHPVLEDIAGVVASTAERLVATVRPEAAIPPHEDGVYAHRWFECAADDWDEFLSLSHDAWPDFESSFEGTRIVGLWRSLDTPTGLARALLVTRYASLAAWERSRPYTPGPRGEAANARAKFLRRAELTQRTIVRVARLIGT